MQEEVNNTKFEEYKPQHLGDLQETLRRGNSCYEMLIKILEVLKTEITHEGAGAAMSPGDLLNKIIGLAHEHNLPDIREKALAYQEGGRG